jgi:integrase
MGLIRKPNSRFWWINIKVGTKRIFESTKTENKKKAQEIYSLRHSELLTGQNSRILEPQKVRKIKAYTFNCLAEEYLKYANGRLKSYGRLKSFVKKLMQVFGNLKLEDFNSKRIENMQSDIIKQNLSIAYANRLTATLKSMTGKAFDWEMITEETLKKIRKVKLLKGEVKRLRYLSDDEAERLISNCEPYLKPIVITALNTGMRRGEIFNLTWNRVDLKNRIILLDKTKNGERREIPINDTLHQALCGVVRNIQTDYVFLTLKH